MRSKKCHWLYFKRDIRGWTTVQSCENRGNNQNWRLRLYITDDTENGGGVYDYGMVCRYLTYDEQEMLKAKKIAEDEIIIIANQKNPITYLSTKELEGIYSGKITSWEMLKGEP